MEHPGPCQTKQDALRVATITHDHLGDLKSDSHYIFL